MDEGLQLVEETFSQDAIVGVIHLHYIEKQILSSGILNSAEGY
jgi:hypothetical protein